MKVLVLGGSGMLGHKLAQRWQGRFDVWTAIRGQHSDYEKYGIFDKHHVIERVDAQNFASVNAAIEASSPNVVINAIGIIKQLPSAKNTITTLEINSIFPHKLAELAAEKNFRLITISTDCVFNGRKGNYSENDISDAEDLYGKSKNLGEVTGKNCLTLRTSIIGRELETAHSLIEWFLSNRATTDPRVKGFTKAIYSGFPTIVMADIIGDMIEKFPALNGLYHVSSEPVNKFDLLGLINKYYQSDIQIDPDSDFVLDRSLNSDKFRTETGFAPEPWEAMIEKMAADPTPYDEYREWRK
jgi:dTDP-4-dehydrorhamnose reductase